MKIYFYHTQDIQRILREIAEGKHPRHFLYGALELKKYGIDVIWHRYIPTSRRWKKMLITTWRILRCSREIDAVYATHYVGLELIIFLRALGLFRKPVVIWHHQPIVRSKSSFREWLGHFFYRGIDDAFFFSQKLINDSLSIGKFPGSRMHLGHWGADLEYYDRLLAENAQRKGFVSTGKERRDFPTLVEAFRQTGQTLDIYVNPQNNQDKYRSFFDQMSLPENIHLHYTDGMTVDDYARKVNSSQCVVICCQESRYTVGLTTVVEALALGLPMICSRNPQIPVDFDREGCGIAVDYYDVEGWKKAIAYVASHPDEAKEMGRKGRLLAEKTFNEERCGREVAELLLSKMSRK